MGRQPCCEKIGLKRGPWTMDEDHKLTKFIINNGIHCWRMVPKLAGLMRCGKSCRLRWTNYLRPDLKRGALTETEENQIIQLHARMGNRWSKIAAHFPGRTDNEIKNHWNTRIKKKLKLMGLDPVTHKPIEHPQRCDQEAKTDQIPASPSWDETSLGVTSSYSTTCPGKEESVLLPEHEAKVLHDGFELGLLHETEDTLLHGYGMLWDSLADEELKPQSKADPSSSSTSFSVEDAPSYLYMVEQSSALVGNNEAFWGGNLDYVPSWSTLINPLEDFFYSGNNQ